MSTQTITVSPSFRSMTLKAVFSIVLFAFTYLLLVALAICLTILCGYLGFMIIMLKVSFITLMLGLGIISMGILVLIFLLKFIFKKHDADLSHLTEISQEQQPELYAFIREIVDEVKTGFPKKIYLSTDVNAAVFYNSSFWSMFLPVRKNLQIGIGLVNCVSLLEFKAILAHEFGHFSQRSMKVGSYVYNVNQIVHNLLYENDSYNQIALQWANTSGYFAPFVVGAIKTIGGIQWVLRKNYEFVNKNHMGLSREMEFHADAIAAHVAGSAPLMTSLPRLAFADHAFNSALSYYSERIDKAVSTENIFSQHRFVMHFLAERNKLSLANGILQITPLHLSRYNKSKLVIKDQWASHPSTEDRIMALEMLNIQREEEQHLPASTVFRDMALLQKEATAKIFSSVSYTAPVVFENDQQFSMTFTEEYLAYSFNEVFNGYYDSKNPGAVPMENNTPGTAAAPSSHDSLFSDEKIDLVYTHIAMENDKSLLEQLATGTHGIKSFDYDGEKYSPDDSPQLVAHLEAEISRHQALIQKNDEAIYAYFLALAHNMGRAERYNTLYRDFLSLSDKYDDNLKPHADMASSMLFMAYQTPHEQIVENLETVMAKERDFKRAIQNILEDDMITPFVTDDMKGQLTQYLSKDRVYFHVDEYDNDALQVLYKAMEYYMEILSKAFFEAKKALLDYQVYLLENEQ